MSNYTKLKFNPEEKNSPYVKIYNFIKNGSTVLDIGCSSGNFGKALIELKNCTVDGIDLNQNDIRLASKVLTMAKVANVETSNLEEVLKGKRYDVIVMADVLEHLVDPVSSLKSIQKLLNRDGFLAFSIPNMAHISVRLNLLLGDFPYTETGLLDKTHLHFYDIYEAERLIERSGYSIEKYDSTVVNFPRSMVRERLANVGLQTEERFFDLINDTYGNIYQFVAKIVPDPPNKDPKNNHTNLAVTHSPAEDVHLYLSDLERIWRDREIQLLRQLRWNPVYLTRRAGSKAIKKIAARKRGNKKG
jgi:2-polyprenyl-3-methyl-5-hydroxy-6-metoxy-1,4-benzoquinol methylase